MNKCCILGMGLLFAMAGCAGFTPGTSPEFPSTKWVQKASLPTGRCCLGAAAINGLIHAVGGKVPSIGPGQVATLEVYDPASNTWQTKSPAPHTKSHAAVAAIGGKLYVTGGFGSSGVPDAATDIYDPATGLWSSGAPMPTPRGAPAAAVVDGILYVIGGLDNSGLVGITYQTVEAYDPSTDTWISRSAMPTARFSTAAGAINGLIYVAGGAKTIGSLGTQGFATLEVYDPNTDTWLTKSPLPAPRSGAAAGVIDGNLYVAGGVIPDGETSTVLIYHPQSDAWTFSVSLPKNRAFAAGVVVDQTLYVLGGDPALADVDALTPVASTTAFHRPPTTINPRDQGACHVQT